jgi:hypothetical protein
MNQSPTDKKMADRPKSEGLTEPVAVASYVATLTAELSVLARHHGLDALGFILEMAQLEAENASQKLNGSKGGAGGRLFD